MDVSFWLWYDSGHPNSEPKLEESFADLVLLTIILAVANQIVSTIFHYIQEAFARPKNQQLDIELAFQKHRHNTEALIERLNEVTEKVNFLLEQEDEDEE